MIWFTWSASILSLAGLALNIRRHHLCWPIWLISTGAWAVVSCVQHNWPMAVMQGGIQIGNVIGYRTWRKQS